MNEGARAGQRQPERWLSLTAAEWALVGTAIAFNAEYNAFPRSPLRVPLGLIAGTASTMFACRAGISLEDQGLDPRCGRQGVVVGFAAAVPIAALSMAGLASARTRAFYEGPAFASISPGRTAYEVLLRIPFATALPEELIFRGALPGMLGRRHGPVRATLISSLLFGLWHVAPALRQSGGDGMSLPSTKHRALHAWASVVVTAGSGVLLGWLRLRSASVVAPWIAHTAANSSAYLAGWTRSRTRR